MDVLGEGLLEALRLLITGDAHTWEITALTLRVSLTATVVALLVGVPLGMLIALGRFPGRRVGWPRRHRDGAAASSGRAFRHRGVVA